MRVPVVLKSFFKNRQWILSLALSGSFFLSADAKPIAVEKPYGLTNRPIVGAFLNGAMPEIAPAISGNWSAVVAFTNLFFTNSVGLTHVPGIQCSFASGNAKAASGRLKILPARRKKNSSSTSTINARAGMIPACSASRFIRVSRRTISFLSITPGSSPARSPASPTSRPIPNLPDTYHDRLERYTLDANGVAIPGSVKIFVDLTNQTVWHHGGGMFFHPSERLSLLDGWRQCRRRQRPDHQQKSYTPAFFGLMWIVAAEISAIAPPRQPTNGFTANYFIPNDNPFVGQSNVLEEFFCLGLRSPHRMTFDPPTRPDFHRRRRRKFARGN